MGLDSSANDAIDALRDDLGRAIDRQTRQLAGRLHALCTFLGFAAAAVLLGFVLLAAVLHEAFHRLAAE